MAEDGNMEGKVKKMKKVDLADGSLVDYRDVPGAKFKDPMSIQFEHPDGYPETHRLVVKRNEKLLTARDKVPADDVYEAHPGRIFIWSKVFPGVLRLEESWSKGAGSWEKAALEKFEAYADGAK